MLNVTGQILGIVAIVLGFLTYQFKSEKSLLLVHLSTSAVFMLHYLLIGAISGCVLNGVGILRDIVYFNKEKINLGAKKLSAILTVFMTIVGLFSWQGIHSLLVIAGIAIHSYCLSFNDAQSVRKSIMITCPMVLLYDVFVFSIGGIIYESVAMISAMIGIIRYRKSKNEMC